MQIVAMTGEHAEAVLAIYQAGIDEGDATFESQAPTWTSASTPAGLPDHRYVAVDDGGAVLRVGRRQRRSPSGASTPGSWSIRSTSPATARGQGVGRALLARAWSSPPSRPASGRSSPASSRRTPRAWPCTTGPASGSSASGSGWGSQAGRWRDVVLTERQVDPMVSDPDAVPGRPPTLLLGLFADPRHGRLPAILVVLTVVTGLVDAVSILALGRVFVANMTGNVVFVGFAIAGAPGFSLSASLAALAGFLLGALGAGVLTGRLGDRRTALCGSRPRSSWPSSSSPS